MNINKLFTFCVFILIAGLAIQSCTYRKDDSVKPCGDFISYRLHVKPIVNLKCAFSGCHVQGFLPGDFKQDSVFFQKATEGKIFKYVFELQIMPAVGELTSDEKQKLKCWLDAGAPEN